MKRMLFLFVVLACMVFSGFCMCQEDFGGSKIKTAEGSVADIDTVKSEIVVNVFENDIAFSVNEDTKIMRGTEDISIDDIDINDSLLIRYYDAETPPYIAESIVDNNLANE